MRVHPAGKNIIRHSILFFIVVNLAVWLYLTIPAAGIACTLATFLLLVMIVQFFRYPARVISPEEKLVFSPADGTICLIGECEENEYLKTKALKVSVFMSPLNVHINWVPVSGTVTCLKHKKGKFHAAFKPKSAEENERFSTAIRLPDGREILTNQVAGAVARRVLNFLKPGQQVTQNMEMGFIRFGSRVDLYLPVDTNLLVKLGDKVKGMQTVIGKLS
ncbi:MAG: phosphatidylserine decarboxylase family protein [Mangrovibacterium sp.]|nr:phosphatidylserine decarboxylase family protein [Mangrovibacterium sp.]